jgi:hypothetical protein
MNYLIFNVFNLGPTMETEGQLFPYTLQYHYHAGADSAFLKCLQALLENDRPAKVEKYIGMCERLYKNAHFFKELESSSLYTLTATLVSSLLHFSDPTQSFPDLCQLGCYYHLRDGRTRRTAFRAVVWALGRFPDQVLGSNLAQAINHTRQ